MALSPSKDTAPMDRSNTGRPRTGTNLPKQLPGFVFRQNVRGLLLWGVREKVYWFLFVQKKKKKKRNLVQGKGRRLSLGFLWRTEAVELKSQGMSRDVKGKEGSHLVEAFLAVNRGQRIGGGKNVRVLLHIIVVFVGVRSLASEMRFSRAFYYPGWRLLAILA